MSKRHILLVDNDKTFVEATVKLLESRNYKVDVACDGADMLEKANQYPDLILLDRGPLDIEGPEICKKIREILRHPFKPRLPSADELVGKTA